MNKPRSLAEQIADLDDPAPTDFDPEAEEQHGESSEGVDSASDEGGNEQVAREHYVDVGKSKLRSRDEVALGPQYAGARIGRDALMNDDDNDFDDPFGVDKDSANGSEHTDEGISQEEDENESKGSNASSDERDTSKQTSKPRSHHSKLKVQVNGTAAGTELHADIGNEDEAHDLDNEALSQSGHTDGSDEDMADDFSTDQEEDESSDEESDSNEDSGTGKDTQRAELRKMMGEEQKMVAATISEAAKADADKGRAVAQQRKTFDTYLNTRIRMQKGLIAMNTLPVASPQEPSNSNDTRQAYASAEEAALKLWNQLNNLRKDMSKPSSGSKRKFEAVTTTPSAKIWGQTQEQDAASLPSHRATLEKWSAKVHGTNALTATRNKLNPNSASNQQQPITSVLDGQLTDSAGLVSRTRLPRSCAPAQASARRVADDEYPNIFDDADFYQLLLKELVEQRATDATGFSSAGAVADGVGVPNIVGSQWSAMREAKTRKKVDTRASKGRKMRYTVHEKLQNFMAPEDRGEWGHRQVDELFGSLLGRRMRLDERDEEEDDVEDEASGAEADEGLMLFRS